MRSIVAKPTVYLALLAVFVSTAAVANPAKESVQALHSGYADIALIWSDLSTSDRRKQMVSLVRDHFASDVMFRYAMGNSVRGFTRAQRGRLEKAFEVFLKDRIGKRLYVDGSAQVSVTEVRPLTAKRWAVSAKVASGDGPGVSFEYILARHSNRWRIVNFFRNGVSELALWRTEFARVLESRGVDELARRLSGVTGKEKSANK